MKEKVINWLKVCLAAILGILQAVLKLGKEIITGVIDIVSLIIPFSTSQSIIENIRIFINTVDEKIEDYKIKLLEPVL